MSNTTQEAGRILIQTFGLAEKSMRARDLNNPRVILNIKLDEALEVGVTKLNGDKAVGLEENGTYMVRGFVDSMDAKGSDGGKVHMLTPLAAKEVDLGDGDWDTALPEISIDGNARKRVLGETAADDNAPAVPAVAVAAVDEVEAPAI